MDLAGDFAADNIEIGMVGPVHYVRTEGLGDPYAALNFRVGMADEPIELRGITHLLEHLSLNQFHQSHFQFNGGTGPSLTNFACAGGPETTGRFLTDVIRALTGGFDIALVSHEARVLKAEAAMREESAGDALLRQRFGTLSYGRSALPEYWLDRPSPEALSSWSNRYFTMANATLVVHGPALPDVDFSPLPTGEFQPAPRANPNRDGGGFYTRRPGPVMGVATLPRAAAASMATGHLEVRLIDRIRHQAGDAYAPFAAYQPISHDDALVLFGSDAGPQNETPIAAAVLAALDELIETGPTSAEVDRWKQAMETAAETSQLRRMTFEAAAESVSFRAEPLASNQWLAANEAVTTEQITETLRTLRTDAIYTFPPNTEELHHPHVRAKGGRADESVGGKVHIAPGFSDVIEVGLRGITIRDDDQTTTVTRDTMQALLTWDDGTWIVADDRNTGVMIRPGLWQSEDELRLAAQELVPADKRIRVGFRFDVPVFKPDRPDHQIFDIAGSDTTGWDSSLPLSRLYVRGGIVLTWLADRALLADWVEQGGADELASYREGALSAADLYERLGGVLASDLVGDGGNEALTRLFAEGKRRPIDRIWASIAGANTPWFDDEPGLVQRAHDLIDTAVVGRRLSGRKAPPVVKRPNGRVASGHQGRPEGQPPPPPPGR